MNDHLWSAYRTWPRVVFFDVGETLIRPRRPYGEFLVEVGHELDISVPAEILAGLGVRIETRVLERTQQGLPFTFPAATSQRFWFETYHDFFIRYLSNTDARRLAQAFLGLLSSPAGYTLFDDTVTTLKQLHADGYRLGIISNWEGWLPTLLEHVGITSFFDHVVISGVCGLEKPDARIFLLGMAEGGYRSEEVVYVGDQPAHDVEPAQKMGLTPILLDRANRYLCHGAYQRIGSLGELPTALGSLRSLGV